MIRADAHAACSASTGITSPCACFEIIAAEARNSKDFDERAVDFVAPKLSLELSLDLSLNRTGPLVGAFTGPLTGAFTRPLTGPLTGSLTGAFTGAFPAPLTDLTYH